MRTVLQRVTRASVTVEDRVVGGIDRPGLVALVAAHRDDTATDVSTTARKIAELRILADETSVTQIGAQVLVVSQFTLYGESAKGRRPSWGQAAPGPQAQPLIEAVVADLRARGIEVATGVFGAQMRVDLVNDGPFTLIVDT